MSSAPRPVSSAPRPDFSRSAISRYVQLAALFRRRIETGEWPVGLQIPTVDELAAECGVARATIRQALDQLSSENLIERFRAKGTFVTHRVQEQLWCAIPTDWSGMLRPSSDEARIEVLSKSPRSGPLPVSHDLGVAEERYTHILRRHWLGDRPYLIADVYLAEAIRKQVTRKDLLHKTSMRIASDVFGSEDIDARHTITIGSADLRTAELLAIPVNAPIAHIRREVIDSSNRLMIVSDGIYRGDVVRIDIRLKSSD